MTSNRNRKRANIGYYRQYKHDMSIIEWINKRGVKNMTTNELSRYLSLFPDKIIKLPDELGELSDSIDIENHKDYVIIKGLIKVGNALNHNEENEEANNG